MKTLGNGGYAINDRFEVVGDSSGHFVFGRGWLLEIVDIESGEYSFVSDGNQVRPAERHFGVFYPAFSLVKTSIKRVTGFVRGVGSVNATEKLPREPLLFETDFDREFERVEEASDILAAARNIRSVAVNTSPSLLTIRAKRLIDENYLAYPSIERIASRLKVSHSHLTRQFKKDLGIPPSNYLHQLRVAEATHRLATGEPIIDISLEVGYNDLSRFYKQFRKATKTSPGVCRDILDGTKDIKKRQDFGT